MLVSILVCYVRCLKKSYIVRQKINVGQNSYKKIRSLSQLILTEKCGNNMKRFGTTKTGFTTVQCTMWVQFFAQLTLPKGASGCSCVLLLSKYSVLLIPYLTYKLLYFGQCLV